MRIRKSCFRWRLPLRPFQQQSTHLVWTVLPMNFPSLKRLFQDYSRSNFECCTFIREHDNQIHAKMYSHDLLTCQYIHAVTFTKVCSSARVTETRTNSHRQTSKKEHVELVRILAVCALLLGFAFKNASHNNLWDFYTHPWVSGLDNIPASKNSSIYFSSQLVDIYIYNI